MTITDADIEFIHSKIQPLIGMKSWNVFRKFGSYLYFDFGKLEQATLGEVGELRLSVLNCAWRIETQDSVLVGCEDVHPIMDERIKQLEDQTIVSFTVSKPFLDTAIAFENGLTLKLFASTSKSQELFWFFSDANFTLELDGGATYRYYDHNEDFLPRQPIVHQTTPISETDIQSVQTILDSLIGAKVLGASRDSMENPIIYFKVKRKKALWELMLLNLKWRLETESDFVAGSMDEYRSYKPFIEHLTKRRVIAVEITRPAFDTTFTFEGNIKLKLFTFISRRGTYYSLKMPDERVLYVGDRLGRNGMWSISEPPKSKPSPNKKSKKHKTKS
jgi:hypothetical protein